MAIVEDLEKRPDVVKVHDAHGRSRFAVLMDADDMVEERVQRHVHGFAEFLREYSVVGLAVGFVAGSQVAVVVKQMVASFLDPAFFLLLGKSLKDESFTAHYNGRSYPVTWGAFTYTLLDFIFILIVVYIAIKLFKLDRFQKREKPGKKK
jgi:large conductance mechanosensitive channel